MKFALITIGNEILSDLTKDTNSRWISKKINQMGCELCTKATIKDDKVSITNTLEYLIKQNLDYIITTGGLGPTKDDKTKDALNDFLLSNKTFKPQKNTESTHPKNISNTRLRAGKIKYIENKLGTANGIWLNHSGINIIALPGVPDEMKTMMKKSLLPNFKNKFKKNKFIRLIKTIGISESKIERIILNNCNLADMVGIGYYPSYYGVRVSLSSHNKRNIDYIVNLLRNILNDNIYSIKNEKLEEVVVRIALKRNFTFSFAESCTGGLMSNRITNVSGSSKVFRGSIVSYSNQSKTDFLNVDVSLLKSVGAVSEKTAITMAKNAALSFRTDYAVSITGIAGPTGGTPEKPVGLVYIALVSKNKSIVRKYNFGKIREINKIKASQHALNLLRIMMKNG